MSPTTLLKKGKGKTCFKYSLRQVQNSKDSDDWDSTTANWDFMIQDI